MTLKYEIKFLDYWHLSSGLSAGAKLDSTVTKDEHDIPYASGKTIKGLVREMALELGLDCDFLDRCFGTTSDKKDKCYKKEPKTKDKDGKQIYTKCYFANAILDKTTYKEIEANNLQNNLYDVIAFTKIGRKDKFDKNGKQIEKKDIAVDDSLREIEVVIPMTLKGEILDIPSQEDFDRLEKSLKMIKRMGLNRNRGLGRCIVEVQK